MADLAKLKAEVNEDPLDLGYVNMTDAEVANSLNARDIVKYVDVGVGELAGVIELGNIYEKLEQANTPEAAKVLRITGNGSPITVLEYSDPGTREALNAMIDKLVADGVISDSDRNAMMSLGMGFITRAEQLGLLGRSPEIGPAHVEKARS
jgi:uncharacterized membrane protein YebE (DUF533 family)